MRQTTIVKKEEVNKKWFVIDAEGQILGKVATLAATYLRGKHKPTFTQNVDMGDNIIIINAKKIALTGNKEENKLYRSHSGYPGGLKTLTASEMRKKKPEMILKKAINGMISNTRLGRRQVRNLYLFENAEHNKDAQKPERLEVK